MTLKSTGSLTAPYPTPARSVGRLFLDQAAKGGSREAFRRPLGDGWESWSWERSAEHVKAIAAGLLSLGMQHEDRVAVIANTRLEWILADTAVMCAGGATTAIYPTTLPDDIAYMISDSGARFVIAEDHAQLAKLREKRDEIPDVVKVVLIDGAGDGDWAIPFDDLLDAGRKYLADHPGAVEAATEAVGPEHLATLIYTSGTTGRPKGVELPHSCWTYEGATIAAINLFTAEDVHYLWLPLSHSFGKVLLAAQYQIGFPSVVDGRLDMIVDNLGVVKPTMMAGAPRIFEKVYAKVAQTATEGGGAKAAIFNWAIGVGLKVADEREAGREPGGLLKLQYAVADRLVFEKIRERLGGRIRYLVSGSAALSRDVARWFLGAGLLLLEGYGLTETSAGTSLNRPNNFRFGTVGQPFAGTEFRIADDGEILIKGPGVMRGYHNLPEQTAEVLSPDGWFATGDVGEIDDAGRLRITDRKKELIKTSGGKYIAPAAIAAQFKAICPIASQMMVTARNFAAAVITLDQADTEQWAASNGVSGDFAAITQDPKTRAYVQQCIDELNGKLNRWETIKKFAILPRDFSVDDGELTPSLKVKRRVVEERYYDVFESLFNGAKSLG